MVPGIAPKEEAAPPHAAAMNLSSGQTKENAIKRNPTAKLSEYDDSPES
jgi:hypothetical protein